LPDLNLEDSLRFAGTLRVAGIDEAGRGPLAGPVSAAAVILPAGYSLEWLDDSKKMSAARREKVFEALIGDGQVEWALAYGEVEEIEEINILRSTHAAMARAAAELSPGPDYCLIDGLEVPGFPLPSNGVVKGDGISLSIAAASVIAKVSRDRRMLEYAEEFPEYGFEKHKGYGTKVHLEALRIHGPCRIHRKTFQPIADLLAAAAEE
jgi:ribonuclease HII